MHKLYTHCFKPALVAGIFFFFTVSTALAQPGSGGPRPAEPPVEEDPATGVPIDGGASLLLAAGGAYGLKKLNDYRKSKNQEPQE